MEVVTIESWKPGGQKFLVDVRVQETETLFTKSV